MFVCQGVLHLEASSLKGYECAVVLRPVPQQQAQQDAEGEEDTFNSGGITMKETDTLPPQLGSDGRPSWMQRLEATPADAAFTASSDDDDDDNAEVSFHLSTPSLLLPSRMVATE